MVQKLGRAFIGPVVAGLISFGTITGQIPESDLINHLLSGHAGLDAVELAEKSSDTGVRKALEDFFEETKDPFLKQLVAVRLARRSNLSNRYFEYLRWAALEAVRDVAPNVEEIDGSGTPVPKTRSSEFLQWCKEHNLDPNRQAAIELLTYPQSVAALGATKDPRAADLLREGLTSHNLSTVYNAAYGLALIGRAEDIQPIIALAEKQPAGLQFLFGAMLSRITNAPARAEIDRLLRPGSILEKSYKRPAAPAEKMHNPDHQDQERPRPSPL